MGLISYGCYTGHRTARLFFPLLVKFLCYLAMVAGHLVLINLQVSPDESIFQNEKILTNKNSIFTRHGYTLDAICEHVGGLGLENYKAWLAVIF